MSEYHRYHHNADCHGNDPTCAACQETRVKPPENDEERYWVDEREGRVYTRLDSGQEFEMSEVDIATRLNALDKACREKTYSYAQMETTVNQAVKSTAKMYGLRLKWQLETYKRRLYGLTLLYFAIGGMVGTLVGRFLL